MKNLFRVLVTGLFLIPAIAGAKVTLPQFITDSMVVQQQSVITLKGHTTSAQSSLTVTPSWNDKVYVAPLEADGSFELQLNTPQAGGPYTITFDDGEVLRLNDIWSGEVWLCSGQSNMEMPVGGWGKVLNYEQEIAQADYPYIRFLQITKTVAYQPQSDVPVNMGGWRSCTPETVENFSSIGYFYAREINRLLGVPVGIIDCTWGGTPAEAWSSFGVVKTIPGFESSVSLLQQNNFEAGAIKAEYERQIAAWMQQAMSLDADFDKSAKQCTADWNTMNLPSEWERQGLPDFDGIVWFQREFDIPAECEGLPLTLHLAHIDDEDVTYLNGKKIVEGSGYNTPRVYSVPAEVVVSGKNVLTIRVSDYGGGGGIWGSPEQLYAQVGDSCISLAGVWSYRIAADFSRLPAKPVLVESSSFPTVLYNAMLHPLHVLPVKGVLWYQGEANEGRDEQYSQLFPAMITGWRELWNNDKMPFYFVQLAGYLRSPKFQPNSIIAALRQAQADALVLEHTGMVSAVDLGNPDDIHPKNKQEVAHRLSLMALKHTYGKRCVADAPELKTSRVKREKVVLKFTDKIVCNNPHNIAGFIVCGADGVFHEAKARLLDNRTVAVWSDAVPEPVAVRYAWSDCPDTPLYGETGLVVAPFKTDKK